eukprot:350425-Chlamydomonas_euryale.AAC.2
MGQKDGPKGWGKGMGQKDGPKGWGNWMGQKDGPKGWGKGMGQKDGPKGWAKMMGQKDGAKGWAEKMGQNDGRKGWGKRMGQKESLADWRRKGGRGRPGGRCSRHRQAHVWVWCGGFGSSVSAGLQTYAILACLARAQTAGRPAPFPRWTQSLTCAWHAAHARHQALGLQRSMDLDQALRLQVSMDLDQALGMLGSVGPEAQTQPDLP